MRDTASPDSGRVRAGPESRVHVLFLADSHLGFDHPARPRVRRRRRGPDFLANHRAALAAALTAGPGGGPVDLVVHGGDLFHRPDVPASLVHQAFEPLKRVAARGVPVFVIPGNHERSRIPFDWLSRHPGVHVFAAPATHRLQVRGVAVVVAGFPCLRRQARTRFGPVLREAGAWEAPAGVRLLCAHQAFEGATVGPSDFTFRGAPDVLRHRDVPASFAAVLSGHIHRHQVLTRSLSGRPLPTPVFYPGSVERTAFAEAGERKGFLTLALEPDLGGGRVADWRFHPLYARPMRQRTLSVTGATGPRLERSLADILAAEPPDAVLRIRLDGVPRPAARAVLGAANLRRLAPDTMNVDVVVPGQRSGWTGGARGRKAGRRRPDPGTLELGLGL